MTAPSSHAVGTVSGGHGRRHPVLAALASSRAWLFLLLLVIFFEAWARM